MKLHEINTFYKGDNSGLGKLLISGNDLEFIQNVSCAKEATDI